MTLNAADILAVVRDLRAADTPDEAQAILLDAIDAGLNVVEACSAWQEWSQLSAASVIVVEGA